MLPFARAYWQDKVLILTLFVAGNIINFNIGSLIDLDIPQSFWSRVSGKYGNMFYWKEKVALCCLIFHLT
jgi:hypothetical protein